MARRATKNTFAVENVNGAEVRRQVMAGDVVPDAWVVDGDAVEETEDASGVIGSTGGSRPTGSDHLAVIEDHPDIEAHKARVESGSSLETQESSPVQEQAAEGDESGSRSSRRKKSSDEG